MKSLFIPPKFDFALAWTFDIAYPLMTKAMFNLDHVVISHQDRTRLRELSQKRAVYFSNHPTTMEPPVAYAVANAMGSRFHFMASRNVFDWAGGFVGEVIRRVGAFSVLAGGADRDAVKMSRQILTERDGKLAIYPEGMCSGENDNLLPFLPGTAQIGFWGLEDAKKLDPNADITVVPAFVKYVLVGSKSFILEDIKISIGRIEAALHLNSGNRNLLRRFLMVGRFLLERTESEYGITPDPGQDYDFRVGRIRHETLNRAAKLLNVEFAQDENAIDKIRELFTALDSIEAGFPRKGCEHVTPEIFTQAKKEVEKAYTFLVTKPNHLVSRPTAERFIEWLSRYETLIFGKTGTRAREAHVYFPEFFTLGEYYDAYKKDKRGTVVAVTERLRSTLEKLMKQASLTTAPIVPPEDLGDI
ncbi:lysophospholipid acyltransferase family protein [Leptospira sp. GIMC2001]|uniref:lysophospholipid acyltransferase family protein n=1 Tax=Leptospira sp. GIMC2001 TaxID=1513297 RepID=UPI00234A94A1|nr:1-acyl-sn-glycerol-3-phosphate acyltransferase [Leptospira sp. GIMC2001]WCL48595.1 1-acyl-sn-glycerol-3-phosphate acyltransferase [Leptospira sp. GIMC2001]